MNLKVYKISSLLVALIFFSAFHSNGQRAKSHTLTGDEAKLVKKDGASLFASGDYNSALKSYRDLYKSDPKNADFNYRLGYCMLKTNTIKSKALEYIEFGITSKDAKKDGQYMLGMAYMHANRWDDAIKAFSTYKAAGGNKLSKEFLEPDRMIEMCNNGKELTSHPVDISFDNLGKGFNTIFEEYNPFVSADGKALFFTSRRKGNIGGFIPELGIYTSDIFWSFMRDTVWAKAKTVGALINTDWDEETVGCTFDGSGMLLYFDNGMVYGDIGVAYSKGKTWQAPVMFGSTINTKAVESGGTISLDGSTMYFASERKEGLGGNDIWMSKRQTTGEWGAATNVKELNTKYDEDAPFISIDGKTLYFASQGHSSMGGYDVFSTMYDDATGQWSVPVNIGYPINTADDEKFFSMSGDGRYAYVAAVRDSGLGDKDIYRITFKDEKHHPYMTVISGNVVSKTGSSHLELTKVSLSTKEKKEVIVYKPSLPGNEYVLAAKPGTYVITVEGYGFAPYEEDITIENTSPPVNIVKNFSVALSK